MKKIEPEEFRGDIWHTLVCKFVTVPIELCILNSKNQVFLVCRKDEDFDGYHIPGSVVNDWETVEEAKVRLVKTEIERDAGIFVSQPQSVGWIESPKILDGKPLSTRHGVLLLHMARVLEDDSIILKEGSGFFDFDNLPANTLECHKFLLPFFKRHLETGEIILGK